MFIADNLRYISMVKYNSNIHVQLFFPKVKQLFSHVDAH